MVHGRYGITIRLNLALSLSTDGAVGRCPNSGSLNHVQLCLAEHITVFGETRCFWRKRRIERELSVPTILGSIALLKRLVC